MLAHTLEPDYGAGKQSHHTGGLVALCRPHTRSLCHVLGVTKNSISLTLRGETYHFVYYPPSFSPSKLLECLATLPPGGTLIGDTNIRYGRAARDSTSTPIKATLFAQEMYKQGRRHLLPSPDHSPSHTDHVHTCLANLSWTYRRDSRLCSDHGLMHIRVAASASASANEPSAAVLFPQTTAFRFQTSLLRHEPMSMMLRAVWETDVHPFFDPIFTRVFHDTCDKPVDEEIKSTVDTLYDIWCSSTQEAIRAVLGTYDPHLTPLHRVPLPHPERSNVSTEATGSLPFKARTSQAQRKRKLTTTT